jgi:hypothetical protein
MRILIYPSDIVKRCCWDSYSYYIVGSEKEAEKILLENKEFELSERDAIVIGLLKVIETDNLIHRFNDYLMHFLQVRSLKDKENFFIKKKTLETAIDKFLDKFPDYWIPPANYSSALKDLVVYIDDLRDKIEKLETIKMTIQNISYDFFNTNSIKKLLNFNNY